MSEVHADRKLVSVVVPVYDTEALIARCLDSILAQTYPMIEVVCVDDGSIDSSLEILESYAAQNPAVRVIKKEHAGVSAARNAGIRAAQGEYLAFVDSDDFVTSDYIARLVEAIEGTGERAVPEDPADASSADGPVDISFIGLRGFERDEVTSEDTLETVLQKSLEGKVRFTDRVLENRTCTVTEVPGTKIFMQLLTGVACKRFRTELIHARDEEADSTCFPETYL
ncbi:MAG: glycosyltransferase family 2 protein, partial [Atopobiaceae bacterium]|nr:glycosyltransferase family 2 protein [Atopobiaceae bacterium]